MLIVLIIIWLLVGALSFIYWWTKDYDFTTNEILLLILSSTLGPIAYFVMNIHMGKEKTLIKKRKDGST